MDWSKLIQPDWTLFLDRDGVINERIIDGYVTRWKDFVFLPGVLEAMAVFAQRFRHVVIVSNQQGVGKGLMTQRQLSAIHTRMKKEIIAAGGRIDLIVVCTQLASDPDNHRKPKPYMAYQAQKKLPEIDFSKSIMVGDGDLDMAFGRNCGMHTVFIGQKNELADACYDSLFSFSKTLK